MTGPTGHRVSSKSKLKTSGVFIRIFLRKAARDFAESALLGLQSPEHPSKENIAMAADRLSVTLALLGFVASATAATAASAATAATAAAGGAAAEHSLPFTVED